MTTLVLSFGWQEVSTPSIVALMMDALFRNINDQPLLVLSGKVSNSQDFRISENNRSEETTVLQGDLDAQRLYLA